MEVTIVERVHHQTIKILILNESFILFCIINNIIGLNLKKNEKNTIRNIVLDAIINRIDIETQKFGWYIF